MKTSRLFSVLVLYIFFFSLYYHELNALTTEDTKRINLGVSAVRSLGKAMQAVKFISWVSSIGSVLGPAMMAVSMILDIVFSFLNIESPEMKYMKAEFKNLNNRLDSFTEQFQEVKRKIDWAVIQLSYGKVEAGIRAMGTHQRRITDSKTEAERKQAANIFIQKYENNFAGDSEELYLAMVSGSTLSDNIFEASAKYTTQNPELTSQFMKGCVQLLIQSFQIKATYMHLKYNNTAADEYFAKLSQEKMDRVVQKSKEVYLRLTNNFSEQSQKDLRRFALNNLNLNHDQFADMFYKYITEKFPERRWFLMVYDPIGTWEEHAVQRYVPGIILFRFAGRNFFLGSNSLTAYNNWNLSKAKAMINTVPYETRHDHDIAKGLFNHIKAANSNYKTVVKAFTVVNYAARSTSRAPPGRSFTIERKVFWCPDPACWGYGKRSFKVTLFG